MKLPDIEYGPVQETRLDTSTTGAVARAIGSTAQVVSEGLAAFGKELVKTQQQTAKVTLEQQLAAAKEDIAKKQYLSAAEIRAEFGDAVPPEVQDELTIQETSGEQVDNPSVPMFKVAGALFKKRADAAAKATASQMTVGPGWSQAFLQDAQRSIIGHSAAVNEKALREMHRYLDEKQTDNFTKEINLASATPDSADGYNDFTRPGTGIVARLQESKALSPGRKEQLLDLAARTEQLRPVWDSLRTGSITLMQQQLGRLNDPEQLDRITPEQRKSLARELEGHIKQAEGLDLARQAEEQAMQIVGAATNPVTKRLDFTTARALVDQLPAGRLKDEVRNRVKERDGESKNSWHHQNLSIYNHAFSAYLQKGSLAAIPAEDKAYLLNPANNATDLWDKIVSKARTDAEYWKSKKNEAPEQRQAFAELLLDLAHNPDKYAAGYDEPAFRAEWGHRFSPPDFTRGAALVAEQVARNNSPDKTTSLPDIGIKTILERGQRAGIWDDPRPDKMNLDQKAALRRMTIELLAKASVYRKAHRGEQPPPEKYDEWVEPLVVKGKVKGSGLLWDKEVTRAQAETNPKYAGQEFVTAEQRQALREREDKAKPYYDAAAEFLLSQGNEADIDSVKWMAEEMAGLPHQGPAPKRVKRGEYNLPAALEH